VKRKPIEQQVMVVMGAASGIGRETALQLAAQGARLVVADFDGDGLTSLMAEVVRSGGRVVPMVADVASFEQMSAVAERAVVEFGRLDTWVHVAATSIYAPFTDTTPDEFQRVVNVDLMGQVYGAKAALPHLIASGDGGLIHISSIEARRAVPYHTSYGAAKHGIHGFLEALRLELKHQKLPVSVTEIEPSSINTPFFDKAMTKLGVKPQGLPPLYDPKVVANTIVHMAERPRREIIVGGAGKAFVATQRLSPRLMDAIMLRTAFKAQKTDEVRSPSAPNDLFGPADTYNRVEGDFGNLTMRHSFSTWLDLHPTIKAASIVGAGLTAGAILAQRTGEGRKIEEMVRKNVEGVLNR
jgi:NAD(P)-dependent dehydrogenase (short-subunit alcohol dehydrogenase family)